MSGEHALHFLKVYSMYMGISTFLFLMSNSVVENITIRVHHHSSLRPLHIPFRDPSTPSH